MAAHTAARATPASVVAASARLDADEAEAAVLDKLQEAPAIRQLAIDLRPFLTPEFDAQHYANNIVEAEERGQQQQRLGASSSQAAAAATAAATASGPSVRASMASMDVQGDVSMALSKVNGAMEYVSRMIHDEVTAHSLELLAHTHSLVQLTQPLSELRDDLDSLRSHLSRLDAKVSRPYRRLVADERRATTLRSAEALVSDAARFVTLCRRLQSQMRELDPPEAPTPFSPELGLAPGSPAPANGDGARPSVASVSQLVEEPDESVVNGDVVVRDGTNGSAMMVRRSSLEGAGGSTKVGRDDLEEQRGRSLARAALSIRDITLLLTPPPPRLRRAHRQGRSSQSFEGTQSGPLRSTSVQDEAQDVGSPMTGRRMASGDSTHTLERRQDSQAAGLGAGLAEGDGASEEEEDEEEGYDSEDEAEWEREARRVTDLLDLDLVRGQLPMVEEARAKVTELMEEMVVRGLRDLSPLLLSTSLQTAFNLGHLLELVRDLLADLTDVIRERVRSAFDLQAIGRQVGAREPPANLANSPGGYASYRPRGRNAGGAPTASGGGSARDEPGGGGNAAAAAAAAAANAWSSAIWSRLETLITAEMGAVCSKVYTLEKVLRLKNDAASGRNFLDEAIGVLGNKPSFLFWTTLAQSFELQSTEASRASPFVQETLSSGFPRLLHIFQEFFSRVSIYTDTVYTHAQQSPETMVLLRSVSSLQSAYVARSRARLDDVVSAAFANRKVANAGDGQRAAQAALAEVDAVRFDPRLLLDVARAADAVLAGFVQRIDNLRARDASAYTLLSDEATLAQCINAELTNCSWHLLRALEAMAADSAPSVRQSVERTRSRCAELYARDLVSPLLSSVRRELLATLSRMHHVDLGKRSDGVTTGSGCSAYMADACERLWYVREQLLVRYQAGVPVEDREAWTASVVRWAQRGFLANAAVAVARLGEGGRLKLTADVTALEWQVSQLLVAIREEKARKAPGRSAATASAPDSAHASSGTTTSSTAAATTRGAPYTDEAAMLRGFKRLLYREDAELRPPATRGVEVVLQDLGIDVTLLERRAREHAEGKAVVAAPDGGRGEDVAPREGEDATAWLGSECAAFGAWLGAHVLLGRASRGGGSSSTTTTTTTAALPTTPHEALGVASKPEYVRRCVEAWPSWRHVPVHAQSASAAASAAVSSDDSASAAWSAAAFEGVEAAAMAILDVGQADVDADAEGAEEARAWAEAALRVVRLAVGPRGDS